MQPTVDFSHPTSADGASYFVGPEFCSRRHFLRRESQFSTTVNFSGALALIAEGTAIRNRFPSGDISHQCDIGPAMLGVSDELKGFWQLERKETQITMRATVFVAPH